MRHKTATKRPAAEGVRTRRKQRHGDFDRFSHPAGVAGCRVRGDPDGDDSGRLVDQPILLVRYKVMNEQRRGRVVSRLVDRTPFRNGAFARMEMPSVSWSAPEP